MQDPYKVLGVARAATQAEIKKAYRSLAKSLHPDRNPGDQKTEQRFKDVSAAYAILGDETKRKRFDRGEIDAGGHERPEAAFRRAYGRRAYGRAGSTGGAGGFGADIFEDLFRHPGSGADGARAGGGARSETAGFRTPGKDVRYPLTVPFETAIRGGKARLRLGDGTEISVSVPPGSDTGNTLRLKGKGTAGFGGAPAGDALVDLTVPPHPLFTRDRLDLIIEVPVTLKEAVEGTSVVVPTLDGKVTVKVPPGSSSGRKLRLRGKGISGPPDGDLYVKLMIVLPDPPDPALSAFVQSWSGGPSTPRKKLDG